MGTSNLANSNVGRVEVSFTNDFYVFVERSVK